MFCTKHESSCVGWMYQHESNMTELDSCLVQNMTLNTDYNAVDASFKQYKSISIIVLIHQLGKVNRKLNLE